MVIMSGDEAPGPSLSSVGETSSQPKPSTSAPAALSPRLTSSAHTIHANGHTAKSGDSLPKLGDMNAKCGGCHKVIEQESGGVVVAFG